LKAGWIHDLSRGGPPAPIDPDVCILGAGPVGLALAAGLARCGMSVAVLEKGGPNPVPATQSANVRFDRRVYRGATIGRALGFGGTSALWGGQLLPVRPADLLSRPQIGAPAWPITYAQIEPYFRAIQEMLGIDPAGFEFVRHERPSSALASLDFTDWSPRLSKWLRFGKRNMAVALHGHLSRHPVTQVWLNTAVEGWAIDEAPGKRRVREIIATGAAGATLRVQPRAVVIAGGALEAARTVLELNLQCGTLSEGVGELAGRYLHDHLSLRVARVKVHDQARFEERFAPFFEGSTMRSLRMELPPDLLERVGLPALYAHFIAEPQAGSGFAVVRDCLRSAQQRDVRLAFRSALRVPRALPQISKIFYSRAVKQRLAFPANSEFFLHIDLEQAPRYDNRVHLGIAPAGMGRPLCIDWDVREDGPGIARAVRPFFEGFWRRNALNDIATLEFLDLSDDAQSWNDNVYDLYHPAGTTRMSLDPQDGVVDENLKIHGTANVYVAGSSVFPSMGAANPTFTAMALALRLAHFIDHSR
jgi:choline dehydrogenase-like flavoprotein